MEVKGQWSETNPDKQPTGGWECGGAGTFVLIGATAAAAAAHVVEDGEVGWRDGVGAAAAVTVVAAQASAGRRLRVDAAGAAAALRGHRRRCAVAIRGVLRLPEGKCSHTQQEAATVLDDILALHANTATH